jgi:dTDP-4-dehydrorhamnose reductase
MTTRGPRPILVFGGSGQLAMALEDAARATPIGRQLRRVGRPDHDLDRLDLLPGLLRAARPALVINAAAYTEVDRAETDAAAAWRANALGPAVLAAWCGHAGIPLVHVSTDYVFDGLKGAPYDEADPPCPTGVYGATKLAGEQAVLAACPRAIVLRTSWVYAPRGRNFVRTMLAAAQRTDRLRVVVDQVGCPTSATDLAALILGIAARIDGDGGRNRHAGVFHAAGTGSTSWHGLATAIFTAAARHGVAAPRVEPIATADWPTAARRPPDSRLDCARLADAFGLAAPPWEASLIRCVDALCAPASVGERLAMPADRQAAMVAA